VNYVFKFAVLLAALGVLVVLITPAADELPGTAAHKALGLFCPTAFSSPFSQAHPLWKIALLALHICKSTQAFLSQNCMLLC
jgi:hypothetical protein